MSTRRYLCNLDDPEEIRLWVKIAEASQKNSSYNTILGVPTSTYFDLDEFVLGTVKPGKYAHERTAAELDKAIEKFVEKIKLAEEKCNTKFDKIAFIDKGGIGPLGMIAFIALAAVKSGRAVLIVRPRKRLLNASIKGELKSGENVLIVSDVATSGTTLFSAAQKIWQFGGKVPCALAWIDRDAGASENLEQYGIRLFAIVDSKILTSKSKVLKTAMRGDIQEKNYIDFGGKSITSACSSLS